MARKAAGFTLIETMVVLAIAAIVIALGVPSFNGALQRQRVSTTMHLLSADMAMARSTAIMRRSRVVVCPRAADSSSGCSTAKDWSRGWMVFTDADGNRLPDASGDILRVSDAPAGDSGVLYLPASREALGYLPDGRSAGANLSVHVCRDGEHLGKVVVNNHGRVRSERPQPGSRCPYS